MKNNKIDIQFANVYLILIAQLANDMENLEKMTRKNLTGTINGKICKKLHQERHYHAHGTRRFFESKHSKNSWKIERKEKVSD